ncbi:MAG: hypothetical protein CMC22_00265 [Flavobacteriaceae bacterium]|nr:hypothetical protein [Flavobacteriaceae bacterium]|tara:strand:+ start:1815 stop:2045 length:231 start_codon:yes stop_codon:yes gene_type:complete
MINLKLTEKQAEVVDYWLQYGDCAANENYQIAKERCKDKSLREWIDSEREDREYWKYHAKACGDIGYKLHKLIEEK